MINQATETECAPEEKFYMKENGTKVLTTCYGKIVFKETAKASTAQFLRLSNDSDPGELYTHAIEHWNLGTPKLLISVTGGAKSFEISPGLKKDFVGGLQKVLSTPGTWVVSGGADAGVMKMVGEANQEANGVCIGIAVWGVVANKDVLIPSEENPDIRKFDYTVGSYLTVNQGLTYLDRNHSHFLLVDDGTVGQFGGEIDCRGKFERYIMMAAPGKVGVRGKPKVPTVLLVLEGGPGTLDTVFSTAIENDIPCVVVKGSGRLADLLVYALELSQKVDLVGEGDEKNPDLFKAMQESINKSTDECYTKIIKCVKKAHLFTIVDEDSDMDTDDAILTALLTNKHASPSDYEKLRLTLMWDRADLAESKILNPMKQWVPEGELGKKELEKLMIMALAKNNVSFVKLLQNFGVSVQSMLTREVLEFLYAYCASPIVWTQKQKKSNTKTNGGIDKIDGSYFEKDVFRDLVENSPVKKTLRKIELTDVENKLRKLIGAVPKEDLEKLIEIPNHGRGFNNAYQQLFIWAVMNNMLEMAVLLWESTDDCIALGLVASAIAKGLKKDARRLRMDDEVSMLKDHQDKYMQLSINLMEQCYIKNDETTEKLVTTKLDLFCDALSSLDFAVLTNQKEFVAQRTIQGLLNGVWNGSIVRPMGRPYLMATIFCPLLLLDSTLEIKPTAKGKDGSESEICTGFWSKFYYFHVDSPKVRFHEHTIGYILFLMLLSYVAMLEKTVTPSESEYLLIVTVAGYAVGEFYQLSHIQATRFHSRVLKYLSSFWNKLDLLCILLFIVALALRHYEATLGAAHLTYALDASLWIIRIVNMLHVDPITGPYVIMIGRMFKDMVRFLVILLIFLMSYGVAQRAILVPSKDDSQMFVSTIFKPYFHIYGELFLGDPDPNITRFGTDKINSYAEPITIVLLGVYLLVSNVLLLNLLIAVFNSTYVDVMENASQSWKYTRYCLIVEYAQQRTWWCPPVSLLEHLYRFFRWLYRSCRRCAVQFRERKESIHRISTVRKRGLLDTIHELHPDELEALTVFECSCISSVVRMLQEK